MSDPSDESTRKIWVCPKCRSTGAELGQSRQSSGALASMFDIEGLRFTTLSCRRCGYTEFYRADKSMLESIFDFGIG